MCVEIPLLPFSSSFLPQSARIMYARALAQQSLLARSPILLPRVANLPTLQSRSVYADKVIDHYEHPRNVGSMDKNDPRVGTGIVGAPACGDVMKLQIMVDDSGKIIDAKFKTFGCGSAIASSSLATEWIKQQSIEYAEKVQNKDIAKELSLPPVKLHCSMLAQDAVQAAIGDYKMKQKKLKEQ